MASFFIIEPDYRHCSAESIPGMMDLKEWGAYDRGEKVPEEPIPFVIKERGPVGDRLTTNSPISALVSSKAVECFAAHHLTGWSTFPVSLQRRGKDLPGYCGLAVSGEIRLQRMPELRVQPWAPFDHPMEVYVGAFFDAASWKGDDLMTIKRVGSLVLSERAADAIRECGLTNFQMAAAEEYVWGWPSAVPLLAEVVAMQDS